MANKFLHYWRKPFPFYFNSGWSNAKMVLAITGFIIFFLLYFRPDTVLDFNQPIYQTLLYAGMTLVVLGIAIVLFPIIFPTTLDMERWTLGKYFLYNFGLIITLSVVASFINYFLLNQTELPLSICLTDTLRNTFIMALMIIIPASYMIKAWVLHKNLLLAQEANERLRQQHKESPQPEANHQDVINLQSDTNEAVAFTADDFVYAEAQDNYVKVFWDEGGLQQKMLRMTLTSVEEQLPNSTIVRCHRSFMVNLEKVEQVQGNSNGLKLFLEDDIAEVPVSRAHVQMIRDKVND